MIEFDLKRGARKPEEQHPSVFQPLVKDQLPKIPISNDEDARLLPGNRQDNFIS